MNDEKIIAAIAEARLAIWYMEQARAAHKARNDRSCRLNLDRVRDRLKNIEWNLERAGANE